MHSTDGNGATGDREGEGTAVPAGAASDAVTALDDGRAALVSGGGEPPLPGATLHAATNATTADARSAALSAWLKVIRSCELTVLTGGVPLGVARAGCECHYPLPRSSWHRYFHRPVVRAGRDFRGPAIHSERDQTASAARTTGTRIAYDPVESNVIAPT